MVPLCRSVIASAWRPLAARITQAGNSHCRPDIYRGMASGTPKATDDCRVDHGHGPHPGGGSNHHLGFSVALAVNYGDRASRLGLPARIALRVRLADGFAIFPQPLAQQFLHAPTPLRL